MIKEYLNKLQELQMKTLGTGVNLSIETRNDFNNGTPWICVSATLEGYHKPPMTMLPTEAVYKNVLFLPRMRSEEEDAKNLMDAYNEVEGFVEGFLSRLDKQ